MSDSESLDLSARDLMPNWVTDLEKPPSQRSGEKPADRPQKNRSNRKPDRDDRGRQGRFDDDRSGRKGGGGRRQDSRNDRGGRGGGRRDDRSRGGGGGRRDFKGRGNQGRDRDRGRGYDRDRPQRDVDTLPNVEVIVQPSPEAVNALAKHIRATGRAYALADVARMVLQARDRYQLKFGKKKAGKEEKGGGGEVSFFKCKADGSLWLSRDEAVAHFLRSPCLKQYYTVEEIETDPPKGSFSVIAVCGMSGQILGPPNHHEYQRNIARLHAERFGGMSFERYKSRVEMHRDEETLEKWKQQVSRKRIYRVGPAAVEEAPAESAADGEAAPEAEADSSPSDATTESETTADESGTAAEVEESKSEEESSPGESQDAEPEAGETGTESEPEPEAEEQEQPEASPSDEAPEDAGAEAEDTADSSEANTEESAVEDAEEEADSTGEEEDESSSGEEAAAEPACEAEASAEILESEEDLARHFRENYAEEAIRTATTAVVSGDVPGRDLSGPLLSRLKMEVEGIKRGFPLPMIQQLCRAFENKGLKFFKRGKKTLYVSVIRPRPIRNEEAFTDRIRKIVEFVREKPRARVVQLLDALVPDYQPPPGGESFEQHHLTQAEHDVLGDLRWLTMEGYVIEFPNSELLLGGRESAGGAEAAAQAPKVKAKSAKQRKRPPRRNKNRNQPRPNPLKAGETPPAAGSASDRPAVPEAVKEASEETDVETSPEILAAPPVPVDSAPEPESDSAPQQPEESAGIVTEPDDAADPTADQNETGAPSPEEEAPAENESGTTDPEPEEPSQETSVTS